MDEKKATSILLANLKGSKKKPANLIDIALACRFLKNKWGFKEMADFFEISKYMLLQIDKINDLEAEVKDSVKKGLLGIEQCYQLSRLPPDRQVKAAKEAINLSAHETRLFVDYLLKNKNIDVESCFESFQKSHLKPFNLLVVPLPNSTYRGLQRLADEASITVHDLAVKILEEYLNGKQRQT